MTKKEAIELLEDLYGAIEDNHGRDYDEAFRMAIEALSADAVHDGCFECRYLYNSADEYPCKSCKQNYLDMWEQEPNDFVSVVLCKNCRYCTEYYDRDGYPYWMCKEWDGGTDADGYCHCGERKEL